jgi:hypothetical protein
VVKEIAYGRRAMHITPCGVEPLMLFCNPVSREDGVLYRRQTEHQTLSSWTDEDGGLPSIDLHAPAAFRLALSAAAGSCPSGGNQHIKHHPDTYKPKIGFAGQFHKHANILIHCGIYRLCRRILTGCSFIRGWPLETSEVPHGLMPTKISGSIEWRANGRLERTPVKAIPFPCRKQKRRSGEASPKSRGRLSPRTA